MNPNNTINGNSIMFNNKMNNYNNNFNLNQINNLNMNNMNIMKNYQNFNNINNVNSMNNVNNFNYNNSYRISNNNLNMSYNFSPNSHNVINDSIEDIYSFSKKRDSFNSCPSMRGNHLSFNTTTDTNNNVNNVNNNFTNNSLLMNNENQNILSMQKLFLNLNPYTASLMRNNGENMNHILQNSNSHLNINNPNFSNNNNNIQNIQFNKFRAMSGFNVNNTINDSPKKSLSTKGFRSDRILGLNSNNFINMNNNNSIDGYMSNDNLSHSSIGSSKAQIKKKRTSLFQNGLNKEKDLRDFKRFCDGLKTTMDEYICSQIGSRIMQKYLKKFPSDIRTLLINNISSYLEKLMCDTYGNYFCQKLYNISEVDQRIVILNHLKDSFLQISKNNCGAHVTQFIIGAAQAEEEKKIIVDFISNHELELAFDPEGTHVLQKMISCFKENERQNINDVLCKPDNLNALCQDAKGMCVMKKLIANTEDNNNKMKIINGLYNHCVEIAQSPFGNYIIQYIFEEWDVNICSDLIKACIDNSIIFSTQKYSSNIIVKIIDLYYNINNNINYNFHQQLDKIFFDIKNIFDLYNNKYGRLLLYKLSRLMTKDEKEKIMKKFEENNDDKKKKEKIDILTEILSQ